MKLFFSKDFKKKAEKLTKKNTSLKKQLAKQFNAKTGEGVVVTAVQPGSIAAKKGIEPGMIILQVNQKPVNTAAEFKSAVRKSGDEQVLLLARIGDAQQFIVLAG